MNKCLETGMFLFPDVAPRLPPALKAVSKCTSQRVQNKSNRVEITPLTGIIIKENAMWKYIDFASEDLANPYPRGQGRGRVVPRPPVGA